MRVTKGDFREYGPRVDGKDLVITINKHPLTVDLSIELFRVDNRKSVKKIILTPEFSMGLVYSVRISDADIFNYCYLICEDGQYAMDPYATVVLGRDTWADVQGRADDSFFTYSYFGILNEFKDINVNVEPTDMVLYKLHMRGFTKGFGLSESKAGNYKGLISKLPYINKLGVTSIELMPVYDFEELNLFTRQNIDSKGEISHSLEPSDKTNFWGYGPAFYFSPKASYFGGAASCIASFRQLIYEIHKTGMECIMEFSFDGDVSDDYIIGCLEFYQKYYHIDGFHIMGCNAPIKRIAENPFLADTKIFYEYIPESILEGECGKKHLFMYNDSFMNVTRQIQNHMNGSMVQFANHMRRQNKAYGFVNYMANVCGFSLWDSYSYGEKHNLDNGEDNRDGLNCNFSFNYGYEGKTNNKQINATRYLQMRNAFAALFLSQSVPLIVAGDENACTHLGNNNPYCQDNKQGYTVFTKNKNKAILLKFVKELIEFRKKHKCIRPENAFAMSDYKHIGLPDLSFHGNEPWMMMIGEEQKALGVLFSGEYANESEDVYVVYNFHYDSMEMALPLLSDHKRWRKVFNTAEFCETEDFSPKVIDNQQSIVVEGSSITVLIGIRVKTKHE